MKMLPASSLAVAVMAFALSACHGLGAECAKDALADLYASELSHNWGTALTAAFIDVDANSLAELGHPLGQEQRDRLAAGYGPLVERFYAKDVWLPGVRQYVDKHLSPTEQCSVLSYYQTEVGRKVFEMQVAAGELEFVRQQATNARKANPKFAQERAEMMRSALPEFSGLLSTGNVP